MKSIAVRVVLIAAIFGAAGLAFARTADATHLVADLAVSDQAEVGQPAHLQVALRSADGGLPAANTAVMVYTDASFGGVTGEVELGRAVTDENGIAVVNYHPSSAGEHQLRVEYLAPGQADPEVATTTISVASSSHQLHQSTSGIQVPGLNVWLIITLVAMVWGILFSVGLRVVTIARAGTATEPILEGAGLPGSVEPQAFSPGAGASEA